MVPPSQDCGERHSHKGRVAGVKNFCLSPPPPMGWWAWLCPCSTLHPNFSTGQMQGGLVGRVPNGHLEAKLVGSLSLSWGSLQWQSRGTLGSQRSGRRDPGSDGGRLLLEAVCGHNLLGIASRPCALPHQAWSEWLQAHPAGDTQLESPPQGDATEKHSSRAREIWL